MFFFGNFSTILPYIVYLSLVWVFILVGFKTNLGSIMPSHVGTDCRIISNEHETIVPHNTYIPELKSHAENTSYDQGMLPNQFIFTTEYPGWPLHNQYHDQYLPKALLQDNLQRGPPEILT